MSEELVNIVAVDGLSIRGTHYVPETQVSCAVVLNSGAGIAARHYQHFARFLAASGIAVLSYDYRGIGSSRPQSLRKFSAKIEDWAELDCSAAIGWIRSRYPSSCIFGIGHSIGALFFGGASNAELLAGVIMISAHTGYYGDYRRGYRLPMALLWHGVMPALTRVFGYFPGRLLRLGDDIPKGVAMQWARRRVGVGSAKATDRGLERLLGSFSGLEAEALIVTIADDSFSTEAAALRVQQLFPRLRVRRWRISPAQAGVDRLGHFGFFRRKTASVLWPPIVAHLQAEAIPVGYAMTNHGLP